MSCKPRLHVSIPPETRQMREAKEEMAPFTADSKSAHKGEPALQHTDPAEAGPCTKAFLSQKCFASYIIKGPFFLSEYLKLKDFEKTESQL